MWTHFDYSLVPWCLIDKLSINLKCVLVNHKLISQLIEETNTCYGALARESWRVLNLALSCRRLLFLPKPVEHLQQVAVAGIHPLAGFRRDVDVNQPK